MSVCEGWDLRSTWSASDDQRDKEKIASRRKQICEQESRWTTKRSIEGWRSRRCMREFSDAGSMGVTSRVGQGYRSRRAGVPVRHWSPGGRSQLLVLNSLGSGVSASQFMHSGNPNKRGYNNCEGRSRGVLSYWGKAPRIQPYSMFHALMVLRNSRNLTCPVYGDNLAKYHLVYHLVMH